MTLAAKLYREDQRSAHRHAVSLDATLRGDDRLPIDVMVDQLSATGFRMQCDIALETDSYVSLGATGLGRHMARVVRRDGNTYGCRFDMPVSVADLDGSAAAYAVVQGHFSSSTVQAPPLDEFEQRLRRMRGVIIVVGIAASWMIIMTLWHFVR